MQLKVEMSFYPLKEDYIPSIKSYIESLHQYSEISIETNTMSTQICGDYDKVMQLVTETMKPAFQQQQKAVFVCKFLSGTVS